jgi:phosphatidyl-myo-inositol dimannoside synthase
MRIGFLTSDMVHGHGWGHHNLSLLQALRRAGVELTVVAPRNSPPIEGIPVLAVLPMIVPRESGFIPKMALQFPHVRRLLHDCDIIHAAIEPFAPLAAWAAGSRPLFVTGHGSYVRFDKQRWPLNTLYRQAFAQAHVVCISHYTARVLASILPNARTSVVNNGVDARRFAHLPPLTTPKRGPTVLSVGAVKERKGTLPLVQAMAAVCQQMPDAQCVIIGSTDGDYAQHMKETIVMLGLQDNVHLLGRVPDETLLGWYGAADVFVLPSINADWKFEGYGLVHMEASAAGLPVIGTTDCGAEDAIDDGVTGLLLPQHTLADRLPQAILALLSDPVRAQQMGAAGREKAQRQTWDHVAEQMITLYEQELRRDVQLNVPTHADSNQ